MELHEFYLKRIDRMLDDPDYEFAKQTLEGIRDRIKTGGHVTAKQIKAIMNIKQSAQ